MTRLGRYAICQCMQKNGVLLKEFSKEQSKYGVPYIAMQFRSLKKTEEVAGCVVTAEDITTTGYNKINI